MDTFTKNLKIHLKVMTKYLVEALYQIHNGEGVARLSGTTKLALASSPLAYLCSLLTDWFSLNSGYVIFVFIAILIDHALGTWIHLFIKRDFSMLKNIKGFFTKTFLALAVGVLVEGMAHILGEGIFITDYFSVLSRLMVFVYPAGSALMNVSILTNGVFPPTAWMEKIKNFNKNMSLKQFSGQDEEEPPSNAA